MLKTRIKQLEKKIIKAVGKPIQIWIRENDYWIVSSNGKQWIASQEDYENIDEDQQIFIVEYVS